MGGNGGFCSVPVVLDQAQVFSLGFLHIRESREVFWNWPLLQDSFSGKSLATAPPVFSRKTDAGRGFVRVRKSLLRRGFSLPDGLEI